MTTEWKQVARPGNQPFTWYLTYASTIPVYDGKKLLYHKPIVEMLPYSDTMLTRRLERGADVPARWRSQVFEIPEVVNEPHAA